MPHGGLQNIIERRRGGDGFIEIIKRLRALGVAPRDFDLPLQLRADQADRRGDDEKERQRQKIFLLARSAKEKRGAINREIKRKNAKNLA